MNDPEGLDIEMLAHELRNTLTAIGMLLEHAEQQIADGEDPSEVLAKARAGVEETLGVVERRLES